MYDLPDTFWAYLAGLVDGDGTISVYTAGPHMSVSNCDLATLEWLKDTLGGNIHPQKLAYGRQRQNYRWAVSSGIMKEALPRMIPFLRIKRPQAELMLAYMDNTLWAPGRTTSSSEKDRRLKIRAELHRLNQRTFSSGRATV